ncbi:hypothetical protein [Polynucleobacter sp. es-MAR-4]|uniref:hypothetical protein n=1 Tax=Polynucleobacter sp. es-MAR-4 TaxID=1855655 RepID=UPI001C0C85D9|nr:hypothetical protein [Polynucleobacter sp. es-MAR-4]MBU3637351.1 hypothetical protein [Polynucleobacter sp. es-MAR-4]
MEIVIAILLALILVAMVSTNKDAATGVGKVIRVALFLLIAGVSWLILIGYSVFYYFSYTTQAWHHLIGIGLSVLLPAFVAWANRDWIKELLTKDNKTILKNLLYLLLGSIAWVTVSYFYQEYSKENPDFGKTLLLFIFIISGCFMLNRTLEKGWRKAFTFPRPPWEEVYLKYEELSDAERKRWDEQSQSMRSQADCDMDEYSRLVDEHYDKLEAIDKERALEQQKFQGVKQKYDWMLYAFVWSAVFMFFGVMGYVWDFAFAWVMTLEYVKGREWVAYATLIGGILGAGGLVFGYFDDLERKKNGR